MEITGYQIVAPIYTGLFTKCSLPRCPFSKRKCINAVSALCSGLCGSPISVTGLLRHASRFPESLFAQHR